MSANVTVSGIQGLQNTLNLSLQFSQFDTNLKLLVNDWVKTAGRLYATREGGGVFAPLVRTTPLHSTSSTTATAAVTFSITNNFLHRFQFVQTRITTGKEKLAVKGFTNKNRRYRENPRAVIQTKVRILRNKAMSLVVDKKTGIKGWYFAGDSATPEGIYVRNQKATWSGGKRLPTHRMVGVKLAYLITSNRTLTALSFNTRVKTLGFKLIDVKKS